jgi:hypothetical protein
MSFHAINEIQYGKLHLKDDDPTYSRVENIVFKPGDVVTGLSREEMRDLWNTGSLEERKGSDSSDGDEKTDPAASGPALTGDKSPSTSDKATSTPSKSK